MKEQAIQAKIIKWLDKNGYWTVKTVVCNKKGVPDILACSPTGQMIAIEVKSATGKPSKLQEYHIAELNNRGAIALVAWSLAEVIAALTPP